ncbi:helix-turn-helix transcriptional regulator [Paenibacillus algorifonticola]|uniref:helix-turn-helix domain-containing protein n=1 Tax=Paenibacillus algorifonticola TaxID=684063 RepID=UPI003D2718CE
MTILGNKLRSLREERNWSKKYVADRLKLKNPSTYANWEYGLRDPDSDTLSKLADLYEVSVDYILGRSESKTGNVLPDLQTEYVLKQLIEKYNIDISDSTKKMKLEQIIQLVFADMNPK